MASALITGVLAGCSDSAESQRAELERNGYADVQILESNVHPYLFSATVNGCTIHLFISQDKEIWIADIVKTANGKTLEEQFYTPGAGVFEGVKNEEALRSNQEFVAICPHP
jgi:hypothetical protein